MLGKTDKERLLFVVFTIRSNKIRVISARDMNRKRLKGGQFFIIVAKNDGVKKNDGVNSLLLTNTIFRKIPEKRE